MSEEGSKRQERRPPKGRRAVPALGLSKDLALLPEGALHPAHARYANILRRKTAQGGAVAR